MLGIVDCGQNLFCLPLSAALIPSLFSPVSHDGPILFENPVLSCLLFKGHPKASAIEQLGEVMCIQPRCVFRREVVLLCLSGDAGLQAAFDSVTRDIVCAGKSTSRRKTQRG